MIIFASKSATKLIQLQERLINAQQEVIDSGKRIEALQEEQIEILKLQVELYK